ncbi:DUF2066 domain-containing protein [Gilvimarinus sp. DA14]|uniref:DUF2066 domain-containing protein n=1 Tax=Gilvimarinus sp. DA14 TaxID=2956798 RepID=UPI0020B7FBCE|nr:DUF2066 domain-containing protein [Gilvimarinus sp. DA14]UTF60200.1 DUF2066 domain-containing protein [Gilvimarinus sp. DA14]
MSAAVVQADQVVNLYDAEELVKSQSQAQREAAAKHALERVIVRVSGSRQALEAAPVKQALVRAQDYVYEYSYANSDETLPGVNGEPVPASLIKLKFSSALVEQLLRDSGLTFWPANRPLVLVWVVNNDTGRVQLVSEPEAWQSLREAAQLRGLPISAPLFDLEDHLAMPAESLWQFDEVQIREASERYRADGILVIRYSTLSDGQLRGDWTLMHPEGEGSFDGAGDSAQALLQKAVNDVADRFASLYAINPSESGAASIAMLVTNVDSFAAYKRAEKYLSSLALVRRVQMHSFNDQGLVLKLFTEGDITRLENTLALDQTLMPASDSVSLSDNRYQARGSMQRPLRYRLAEEGTP